MASGVEHEDVGDIGHQGRPLDSNDVSPLEQEVLDEYARLAGNMEKLSQTLTLLTTATSPTTLNTASNAPPPSIPTPSLTLEIAESLRLLERKVASVYTLMKASVYSIVLQQGEVEMGESTLGRLVDGQLDDGDGASVLFGGGQTREMNEGNR